ncbi:glycerophosphodiester phosphodiesterase [Plantactinospora soyae]|uniref:Glycerophosphoryl diester phosphodiesterase n=1 Tax=Plantactinospora soyae TaxID=1544732 RepID=A0A927MC92_9ACTN|nr:glycerophosphodiester phosphodiesterase family protein [Plantactinospora soyae]MBE1490940.1 glycerophosphoryl diester phosphodiesterase [Plantactinospora soyae]
MFLTIAHRGDPLAHRENTMPAFQSAVDKGANTLEFDLRLTRDGRIALLHDARLDRLWDVPAAIADLTLAQVRTAGTDGHQVPTLDELLVAFPRTTFLVDLKTDDVVEPAVRELRRHGDAFDRAIFVAARSGGREALVRLRAAEPDALIGLDWTEPAPPPQDLLDALRPQYFGPRWRVADACGVPAMRERGYQVWVGPLVAEADLAAAYAYGVDGIVSDDVDALLRLAAPVPAGE